MDKPHIHFIDPSFFVPVVAGMLLNAFYTARTSERFDHLDDGELLDRIRKLYSDLCEFFLQPPKDGNKTWTLEELLSQYGAGRTEDSSGEGVGHEDGEEDNE